MMKKFKNPFSLLFLGLITISTLVLAFLGYRKFAVSDSMDPSADQNVINKLLYYFTPLVSAGTVFQSTKDNLSVPILDVRSEAEYQTGHIPGAILVPENKLYERIEYILPYKHKTVYLYCNNGHNGAVAIRLLRIMGYRNAYNIKGGLTAWVTQGYKVNKN